MSLKDISQIHHLQFSILYSWWCSLTKFKGKVHLVALQHIMVVFFVNINLLMQSCSTPKYYCVLRHHSSSYSNYRGV